MPILRVEMLPGRTLQQKRELAEALTRETVRILGGKPEGVQILIDEIDRENWAAAGTLYADK